MDDTFAAKIALKNPRKKQFVIEYDIDFCIGNLKNHNPNFTMETGLISIYKPKISVFFSGLRSGAPGTGTG